MILVTGGWGFIGSHLVERLIGERENVAVIDKKQPPTYVPESVRSSGRVRWYVGDLCNRDFVYKVIDEVRPSIVFHLAAIASHRLSIDSPADYVRNNVLSTLNLLEVIRRVGGCQKFVFSSTASVYGDQKPPHREDSPRTPRGPYAYSKVICEDLCRLYSESYGIDSVVLRYFNVIGERCRDNIVLKIFVERSLKGEPLHVNGRWIDGEFRPASRDFTYVGDIVEGTLRASRVRASFEVFNLGAGRPVTVKRLAELVNSMLDSRSEIVFRELAPHEALESYSDPSKAISQLRWSPRVDIEEAVRRYVDWYLREGRAMEGKL